MRLAFCIVMKNLFLVIIVVLLLLGILLPVLSTLQGVLDLSEESSTTDNKEDVTEDILQDNGDSVIDIYFTYQHVWYEDGEKLIRVLDEEKCSYIKNQTYEYKVKDYFDSGFITKAGDVITGTALKDRRIVIEVYEVWNYVPLLIDGNKAVSEISVGAFLPIGKNNECLAILNDSGTTIQSFAIDITDNYGIEIIGSYIVKDFQLANGDYLIVFPHTGQFIGYNKTNKTRIMKQNLDFVEFYNECYSIYY